MAQPITQVNWTSVEAGRFIVRCRIQALRRHVNYADSPEEVVWLTQDFIDHDRRLQKAMQVGGLTDSDIFNKMLTTVR